jgi:hypothetical protein
LLKNAVLFSQNTISTVYKPAQPYFSKIEKSHLMKHLLVLAAIIIFCFAKSQNPVQISISNTTLAATDSVTGFAPVFSC